MGSRPQTVARRRVHFMAIHYVAIIYISGAAAERGIQRPVLAACHDVNDAALLVQGQLSAPGASNMSTRVNQPAVPALVGARPGGGQSPTGGTGNQKGASGDWVARGPVVTDLAYFDFSSYPVGKHLVAPHVHPHFQLVVILKGSAQLLRRGHRAMEAGVGEGYIIPPLAWHGFRFTGPYRQGSFHFHLAPHFWRGLELEVRKVHFSPLVGRVVAQAGADWNAARPLAAPGAIAALTWCVLEILKSFGRAGCGSASSVDPLRQQLWSLMAQVEEAPGAEWSVPQMAQACYLSPDYFSRRFHEITGTAPHQFVLQARMRFAVVELLFHPDLPIKRLARRAGYAGVHAFTRAFSEAFGMGPAAYRRFSTEKAVRSRLKKRRI